MAQVEDFSNIKGHLAVINILKKAVQEGKVSHAYLLLGPTGVGKMTTALALSNYLLKFGDPQAMIFLQAGAHPDLLVIEKEENRSLIGIEQITRIMEPWLALKPFRSDYRVILIRDAHLLSEPAGNALLKILEEPPPYAVIILIADEAILSETILSRCQLLRFSSLTRQLVEEYLLERGIDQELAQRAAVLSQGSIGEAIRFASEEEFAGLWDKARLLVTELTQDTFVHVFNAAETMEAHPELLCAIIETILRDVLIFRMTGRPGSLQQPDNIGLTQGLGQAQPEKIMQELKEIARLKHLYRQNISPLLINIQVAYAVREALK